MTIAIHKSELGFHTDWINYCKQENIPYKIVNCYSNTIIQDLEGCNALMWHHNHQDPRDVVIGKQLLFALEHTGFKIFPDFNTSWHFDDKVGQKYLFERINLPFVKTYLFVNKSDALKWAEITSYPKVFKLRGGAGSSNVKLARTKKQAIRLINRSFGNGFPAFDSIAGLKERIRKYKTGQGSIKDIVKGVVRIFNKPVFAKVMGNEVGYAYFQEFIPNNTFDIRIVVIDNKAFGLKRMVRENDFRASGSGKFYVDREHIDERCVKISLDAANKLKTQSAAFDFVFDENNNPLIVEISYGFAKAAYGECPGYWDKDMNWVEGKFNSLNWIVDALRR